MFFFNRNSPRQQAPALAEGVPFALLLGAFAFLAWHITKPLMSGIIGAGMLAFIVRPLFKRVNRLLRGKIPGISAAFTLLLVSFIIVIPILLAVFSLGDDITTVVGVVRERLSTMEHSQAKSAAALAPSWTPRWLIGYVESFFKDSESVKNLLQNVAGWAGTFLTDFSKQLIQRASSMMFEIVILLMTSFFFIRDGESIVNYLKSITPLRADEKTLFFERTENLFNAVVYGVLITVSIQALLGGLGWWLAGLSSPVFFGMLMFFFGLFPAGTAVVWLPGAIYLISTGSVKAGVLLLIWGTIVVSAVDNVLRPFLISGGGKGERISTLLVILGLFGGVIAWGFIGVFLGPLLMVLFVLVLDIYRARREEAAEA